MLNCRLCPTSVSAEAFLYLPVHLRCWRKQTCSLLPSFRQPPRHILQALHKQEPQLKQLGAVPSSRRILSLSVPSCCLSSLSVFSHFLVSVAFSQCRRELDPRRFDSLPVHTHLWVLWRGVSNPLSMMVCLPPAACCAPQHLDASGVFYCFLISKYKSQGKINLFISFCYICNSL